MKYTYILGIKAHKISKRQVLEKIKEFLKSNTFHYISTLNPEFILEAQKDEEFREILNNSDIAIADGIGLKFAAWMFGENLFRVAGSDLTNIILKIAREENHSVYFFIWGNGLSQVEDIKKRLNLNIEGQAIERDGRDIDWDKFNNSNPDILLLGLGAPYQEKIINNKFIKQSSVKLAMGIGGTFDFITGKVKRAPKTFRILGLEWLWRLTINLNFFDGTKKINRVKRILNAVIIFPYNVLKWRIRMTFLYRKGIIAVIINKENKFLICERMGAPGHWQFPQGGFNKGESIEQAVFREVAEETGIKSIKINEIIKKIYKYKFKNRKYTTLCELDSLKYGYKGQSKYICITEFFGQNDEIKLDYKEFRNYQWVSKEKLIELLHPFRKKVGEIALDFLKI